MKQILLLLGFIMASGCSLKENQTQNARFSGPLTEFFSESDKIINEKYNLGECTRAYTQALELNDEKAKEKSLADIEAVHKEIISEISERFPVGSLGLPTEQMDKSNVEIGRLYISAYMFPWSTATLMSYQVNFDCEVYQKKDMWLVRIEFIDADGDLFMTSNIGVFQSGNYSFDIHPEIEFFHFEKAIVSVN